MDVSVHILPVFSYLITDSAKQFIKYNEDIIFKTLHVVQEEMDTMSVAFTCGLFIHSRTSSILL